tara:strand:- start:6792 stop:7337 length:546 start_codon:yes stop_codon:yes gene_type:complete
MEVVVNSEGLQSVLCETLTGDDLKNFAKSIQCVGVNLDETKDVYTKYIAKVGVAFEMFNRNRVASKFENFYPEFPQRFLYSLPYLSIGYKGDYLDGVSVSQLGDNLAVCGVDVYERPFVGTKTEHHTTFINARYTDYTSSHPRTSGDRSIFSTQDPLIDRRNEKGKVFVKDFIMHVANFHD